MTWPKTTWGVRGWLTLLSHSPTPREIYARNQAVWKPGGRNWWGGRGESCLLACSLWLALSAFLESSGPVVAVFPKGWVLPYQSLIMKIPHRVTQKDNHREIAFNFPNAATLWYSSSHCGEPQINLCSLILHNGNFAAVINHNVNICVFL